MYLSSIFMSTFFLFSSHNLQVIHLFCHSESPDLGLLYAKGCMVLKIQAPTCKCLPASLGEPQRPNPVIKKFDLLLCLGFVVIVIYPRTVVDILPKHLLCGSFICAQSACTVHYVYIYMCYNLDVS